MSLQVGVYLFFDMKTYTEFTLFYRRSAVCGLYAKKSAGACRGRGGLKVMMFSGGADGAAGH